MSSTTSTRPMVTLQPSTQEDAYAYIAAIRLASSVRNMMDAEKADEDSEVMGEIADSWGHHHPNLPPPPPAASTLNQTSSAHSASNVTRPDSVQPRDTVPSSSHTMNKAEKRNDATLEALKQHHGYFPPPEPSIGSTQGDERIHRRRFTRPVKITATGTISGSIAIETSHGPAVVPNDITHDSTEAPPEAFTSRRTGNVPIHLDQGPLPFKLNVPGGIPAQCQLYATNTDANLTFTVCPVTKRNDSSTHDLESRSLHPRDASNSASNSHILAIRNTPMCEAPTSFKQRAACGRYDGFFALAFFILFVMIVFAWLGICKRKSRQFDEEIRSAAWPRPLNASLKSFGAKLRGEVGRAHKKDHSWDEKLGAQQYDGVAWRSASHRSARTDLEGMIRHDAGPIGVLPGVDAVELDCPFCNPLALHDEGRQGIQLVATIGRWERTSETSFLQLFVKLAVSKVIQIATLSFFLFFGIALVLAPPSRFITRVSAIFDHLTPLSTKSGLRPTSTASRPLTTSAMAPQKFKKPPQAPPLFTGTPKSVIEDTKRIIERSRTLENKVVAEVKPQDASFEKVLLPMAYEENEGGLEAHIIGFYQSVSTNQALRDASTEAEKLMDDYSIESSMREDVYKLVEAAFKKDDKLDAESQRLLEKTHKDYIRNGLGLPAGPKRDRYKEIKKRLSQLCIVFSKNLNEEVGGIWFTPEQLKGVPEDVTSLFEKGEGENAGKLKMTFKKPDYFPTLKYAKDPATRKKALIDDNNKLPQNIPIFREVILLRDEAARLLGYPNHAAFIIEDKMAKTTKTVDDFLGDLRQRLTKGGRSEIKTLTELKKQDYKTLGLEQDFDGNYYLWDNRYYDRLMLEKDYSLDQEQIAEWFPLETSIRGMLTVFETLFGLVFVEVTGEDRSSISPSGKGDDIIWHPDCQVFSVWDSEDEGSGFVGYLYLDLHPREGKYGHAANFNIQPGFINANGTRHYPVTALVCNFSKPTPKKPSLLKHEEVTTLFHELGHGIHDLVSKTHYSRFHGTNVVRDFVEAPSQMLENWCWTPSQLKALSQHYSTLSPEYEAAWREQAGQDAPSPEKKLPDELIDNLIKTKHVNDALFNLRQLHFGIFDMTIHEPKSHDEAESFKLSEMYNKLGYDITQLDSPAQLGKGYEWGHGQTTFGHLLGGYDAGYYGYLSSQVYSADMFHSVFATDPMNGKEGRRYRHMVLEKGGSQDEMETLKGFLGREPNGDAFYRELGLS